MFTWPGFELRVALRFLREGRMQTVLIIVGVAAGVAVIAYISALINGLQNNTLNKTLGAQAHISVRAPDDVVTPAAARLPGTSVLTETQPRAQRLRSVANWQALLPLLEKMPSVAGVSPMVSGAGLALRGEAVMSIALMGVELERYDRMVGLRAKVVSGAARLSPGEAIIGRELAQDLGVRVGDRLTVQTSTSSESLRVTALVDLGIKDLNRRTVIVPLRAAQNLLALPGGATSLDVTLHDVWVAQTLAEALRAQFPYKIESWQESNAQLVSALNAQSVSTSIIRAVVLAVVVLGIASVLVVSVVQKQREIGILRAKVVSGTARLEPGEAIIGRELAQDLGVRVGDRLTVQTSTSGESLRVTALVDLGIKDLNQRTVIVPLRAAQNLLALPGGATSLDVTLHDVWVAQTLAQSLRAQFPYKIESWQESNAQLVSALNAQSVSTSIIRAVVLAVVVLGIASVLVVSVVQKQREIGILRAMGATRGQVLRLFLVQGAVVGAVGSALGLLLAVALIWVFTAFVRGSDGLPLFSIALPLETAWRVALIATACGVLAAVAPARRAAQLDPAQAIRL